MIGNNNACASSRGLFEIGLIECIRSLAKVGESAEERRERGRAIMAVEICFRNLIFSEKT